MTEQQAANAMPGPSLIIQPPGMFPTTPPVATQERLAKPSQFVVLHNTSEVQVHGWKDRWETMQMFAPGEKREICVVCDELDTLIELSRTDRGFFAYGPRKGQAYPAHPLRVVGIPLASSRPSLTDREAEIAQKAAVLASREAELAEREQKLNALVGAK
jgi:hypothetical protein